MSRLTLLLSCLLPLWLLACDDSRVLHYPVPTPANYAEGISPHTLIVATFDQSLDAASIRASSFYLYDGLHVANVGAALTLRDDSTPVLEPNEPLQNGWVYWATVTREITDTSGDQMAQDFTWSFTVADALTVSSTAPQSGALAVPIGSSVSASFGNVMDLDTLAAGAFALAHGEAQVSGVVSLDATGRTATFTPAAPLGAGLTYTATVTTAARDVADVGLAAAYTWSFTTESPADPLLTAPPTVSATVPANASINVALATPISAIFSEAMASATLTPSSFLVTRAGLPIAGVVSYDAASRSATFTPSIPLQPNAEHTATLTSAVTNAGGTALAAPFTWSFTTLDDRPTVVAFTPARAAPYISINDKLRATFSTAMNPATLSAASFTLSQGQTPVAGSVAYDAVTRIATFSPNAALIANAAYTATISTAASDASARPLATSFSGTFTTTPCSQLPVNLGSTRPFALLAGGGVTDSETGSSTVIGNVGSSPSTNIAGFSSGAIIGSSEANSQLAQTAKADFELAYSDAETRDQVCAVTIAATPVGTVTPGLYRAASSLTVAGQLILDAQGDADAVFLFQLPGGLSTLNGSQLELRNGARAENVFWQMDAGATIGSLGAFAGTILSRVSVTLNLGSSLEGRAFAGNGSVSLDGSDVFLPTP